MNAKYLLALNANYRIGSQTLKKLLNIFGSGEGIWKANKIDIAEKLGEKIADKVFEAKATYDPDLILADLAKQNIGYITMYDKAYPSLLRESPDCPAILYVRGNVEILSRPSIAVVGSRKYTSYGKKISQELSKACSGAGLSIISGLALGIDAFAHRAALDLGNITVGVLGCGLDKVYPSSNLSLAHDIIDNNGAIISEFAPGTVAMKQNFPLRNRIIAGLSLGTLVIEAAEQSGALITALCALEYNREVYAVPGNIDSEMSVGTNMLIQKGAKLILNADDILEDLNFVSKSKEKISREILPDTKEEEMILEILKRGDKLVDDLSSETGLDIVTINTSLTLMEMKGFVENIGGGRYKIK